MVNYFNVAVEANMIDSVSKSFSAFVAIGFRMAWPFILLEK
jgi:flagellar biosynthesis protein FliR